MFLYLLCSIAILFYSFDDKVILDADSFYILLNESRIELDISPLKVDKRLEKKAKAATGRFLLKEEMPESSKYQIYSFTVEGRQPEYPVKILDENAYLAKKLESGEYQRIGISIVYHEEKNVTFGVIYME